MDNDISALILIEIPRFFKSFVQHVDFRPPPPLKFQSMMILGVLYEQGTKSPKELAHLFRLSRGNIKYHLDKLEKLGYITIEKISKKKHLVKLTPKGFTLLKTLNKIFKKEIKNILKKIPQEKLEELREALLVIKDINENYMEV